MSLQENVIIFNEVDHYCFVSCRKMKIASIKEQYKAVSIQLLPSVLVKELSKLLNFFRRPGLGFLTVILLIMKCTVHLIF